MMMMMRSWWVGGGDERVREASGGWEWGTRGWDEYGYPALIQAKEKLQTALSCHLAGVSQEVL